MNSVKERMDQLRPVHAGAREQESRLQPGRRQVYTLGSPCLCPITGCAAQRTEVSGEDEKNAQDGVWT